LGEEDHNETPWLIGATASEDEESDGDYDMKLRRFMISPAGSPPA
jgi:hypothetical protein